jgi:serine/threonine protein kinase
MALQRVLVAPCETATAKGPRRRPAQCAARVYRIDLRHSYSPPPLCTCASSSHEAELAPRAAAGVECARRRGAPLAAHAMSASPPPAVADPYIRIRQLGAGSFGRVLLVRDSRDNELYVLKEVDLQQFGTKARTDALKEVEFLNQLRHPNIVAYREYYEQTPHPAAIAAGKDGAPDAAAGDAAAEFATGHKRMLFIVMQYCDGGDLDACIKRQRKAGMTNGVASPLPFPEATLLHWLAQIILALKHVHDRRILHRDVKAENIFLMSDQRSIRVGDFGISKHLSSTMANALTRIGTPYYLRYARAVRIERQTAAECAMRRR